MVTQPLKIMYLDGSSAAKSRRGHLDTSDLIVYGRVEPSKAWDEGERIWRHCNWGAQYDIDGYVRYVFVPLLILLLRRN